MNEFNQQETFEATNSGHQNTVTNSGLILKTMIGLLVAFGIAIPNLMQGKLFLSFLYEMNGPGFFFTAIAVTIVLGLIWGGLYRTLMTDHGPIFNSIAFILTSAFAGLFLGNALIVAVIITGYYADIDFEMVMSALMISSGATFIAVVGGVVALPRLKMDGPALKFFRNASILLVSLTFVSGIMWLLGYFLNMFGITFILELYYQLVYGLGPVSIAFSIICILAAEFLFLVTLARSKMAVGNEPKHMEFFYAIILVNAVIRIYVEIFKLVLKILAKNNKK
ncbi:hypothetical protein RZE82_08080 [Mollicutes bacterium LVI A0039]|nr:hypothetical protein RZE82_08080 [Mollicutes bacterium LVI A0039]